MGQTNSPVTSRLFVQEGAGNAPVFVAAVGVRGVVIDPRQLDFTKFVTEQGVETMSIPRYPNPTNFDVTFGLYFRKWFSIFRSLKQGCHPNFFIANAVCEDTSKIQDPDYFEDGAWLYNVDATTGYQLGNNIIVSLDANAGAQRQDQVSFIHDYGTLIGKYSYSRIGGLTANPIKSLAIVDEGKCSNVICRPCEANGCLQYLINDGTDYEYSLDGAQNFSTIATSGVGVAQAFNGVGFMVNASSIKLSADISAAVGNWTSAATDVAFAGLCNIAQVDARTMVVGGTQGAVWRSKDGGANWTQVRAAVVGTHDFVAMGYNTEANLLVAVTKLTTAIYVETSPDRGKSWNQVGAAALVGEVYGANTNPQVFTVGPNSFVVVNGNLYKLSCDSAGVASTVAISIVGATGSITGIGGIDPRSPNQIWLTTSDSIFRSNDGLATAKAETLPFTITSGGTVTNPTGVCHSKYGDSMIFAFGNNIYEGKDWESFFA